MAEEKINSEIDVQDSGVEKNVANTESLRTLKIQLITQSRTKVRTK